MKNLRKRIYASSNSPQVSIQPQPFFPWAFIWRVAIIYVMQLGFCLQALGGSVSAEQGKEP